MRERHVDAFLDQDWQHRAAQRAARWRASRTRPPQYRLLALLAGLTGWLYIAACGPLTPAPDTRESHPVVMGEEFLMAETVVARGRPVISHDQALAVAQSSAPGAQQATGVRARYVTLTLLADHGRAAGGVRARPVWLVTFSGVVYDPAGNCACAEQYRRPATAVAVDARDGSLVAVYGLNNDVAQPPSP